MPINPYDFSVAVVEFTDIDRSKEQLANDLIDQTLLELRLMDKESKIRLAIYKGIRMHAERVGVIAIDIPDIDYFIDRLASDIAQVV